MANANPFRPALSKKAWGLLFVGLTAGALGYSALAWKQMPVTVTALNLDLSAPDALIVTQSLSQLPRDLLSVPLLRDVLRKELAFYYEEQEDRLSLGGALKRIAYEHDLTWSDKLIRSVLDEPAELALWRGTDGTLKHFAFVVERSSLTRVLGEAAKVALKDRQLSLAGHLTIGGTVVPVFALRLATHRTMLLAPKGARLAILSDAGMLLDRNGKIDQRSAPMLASVIDGNQSTYLQHFKLEKNSAKHRIVVKAAFLSFGYQTFFPAFKGLKFELNHDTWSTQAWLDNGHLGAGALDSAALAQALPVDPAACVFLPVDWNALPQVVNGADSAIRAAARSLAHQAQGPVAACWYAHSKLMTPLFAVTLKSAPNRASENALAILFDHFVRKSEAGAAAFAAGADGGKVIERSGKFNLMLALHQRTLLFSPDGALTGRALATLQKKYPALADTLPANVPGRPHPASATLAVFTPRSAAQLIQAESFAALPATKEPVFRRAAETHWVPRLTALALHAPHRAALYLPVSGAVWADVDWQAIKGGS